MRAPYALALVTLFTVVGGVRQPAPAAANFELPDNNYHLITVARNGSLITLSFDGINHDNAAWCDSLNGKMETRFPRLSFTGTMPTVYFEDLEIGSVHLGRECVCEKDEMLEFRPTQ